MKWRSFYMDDKYYETATTEAMGKNSNSTSGRLLRHDLPNSKPCILCVQESETVDHVHVVGLCL
jgi:hypothetical protein